MLGLPLAERERCLLNTNECVMVDCTYCSYGPSHDHVTFSGVVALYMFRDVLEVRVVYFLYRHDMIR